MVCEHSFSPSLSEILRKNEADLVAFKTLAKTGETTSQILFQISARMYHAFFVLKVLLNSHESGTPMVFEHHLDNFFRHVDIQVTEAHMI